MLEALEHVEETIGKLRAEATDEDATMALLWWAASACREATEVMDELRGTLNLRVQHSSKRRRVSWDDSDGDVSEEPDEDASGSSDDDRQHNSVLADLDGLSWPLPASHTAATEAESLATSLCTYVKWGAYVYRVNYATNVLQLVTDTIAAEDWSEMEEGYANASWRLFPDSARFYPTTISRMGSD